MKIKTDFITNSSSTNFIFIFKGNTKEDLYAILRNNSPFFKLEYKDYNNVTYNITVEDIIDSIEKCIDCKSEYSKTVRIQPIDILIKEVKSLRETYEQKTITENDYRSNDWIEFLNKENLKLNYSENAKTIGLNSFIEIEFGDNHGDISNCIIGEVMDYKGRNIYLSTNKIMLLSEIMR